MIRKVMAGKGLRRAAGTVVKRLAGWLEKKGYVAEGEANWAKHRGVKAARDLPLADELVVVMNAFAERQGHVDPEDTWEGHFEIRRVEHGALWLVDYMDGEAIGRVPVSPQISGRARVGWSFFGAIGRVRGKWRLLEAWNVYPD